MGEAWYPGAIKQDQGNTGGTMKGGPPRGVIHTSEGYSPRGGRAYYHFTVGQDNRSTGDGQVTVYQWRPVDHAARGLRNLTGGTQTNREGDACIQVAFAWKANRIDELPDGLYEEAKGIVEWAQVEHGIPLQSRFDVGHGNSAYGYQGTARMTIPEWDTLTGWCGHQEVPENTHWDAGRIDWLRLLDVPDVDPPLEEDDEMPTTFRVDEQDSRWEPWALLVDRSVQGDFWDPNESSAVIAGRMNAPNITTPSQEQLDHISIVVESPLTDSVYSHGKELTLFGELVRDTYLPDHAHEIPEHKTGGHVPL